jgi:GNAT superfamily N-acetyltransferase
MKYQISEIHDLRARRRWHERFRRAYDGECAPFNLSMISGNVRFFVASKDGKEVGYIRIDDKSNIFAGIANAPVWNIGEAYVKPGYRSKGVLRALIQYVVEHCNVEMLHIDIDRYVENAAYYRALGFNRIQKGSGLQLVWIFRQQFADFVSKIGPMAENDNENLKIRSVS